MVDSPKRPLYVEYPRSSLYLFWYWRLSRHRSYPWSCRWRTSSARAGLPRERLVAFLRGQIPGAIFFLARKLKISLISKMPSPRARLTSRPLPRHASTRGMNGAWSPTCSVVRSCASTSPVSALTHRCNLNHPRRLLVPSPHFLPNYSPELTALRPKASMAMVTGPATGF